MDEKEKPKEGAGTDLVAGAAGATVGLATLTLLTPAVGVEPAAVAAGAMSGATSHFTKRVVGFVSDAWKKRTGRKTQKLIEGVAKIENKSADDVAEELIPIIDDDSASEPVWRTVRAAIETPDDAAITPLATLLNMYRRQNPPQRVDVFFRGMTRMLSECDAEGLADLRAVIAEIKLKFPSIPAQVIVTAHPFTFGQGAERILTFRDESDQQTRPVTGTRRGGGPPMVNPPSGPEVPGFTRDRAAMAVLRLSSPGVGYPRSETDTQGVALSSETIRRLAAILGAETPTT